MSNVLAISVALKKAYVALEINGKIHTSVLEDDTPTYFVGFVAEFLDKFNLNFRDIRKLIVASGPGSFTGLRVGISFAKAIRELTDIDVICVSYFDVMKQLYLNESSNLFVINSENPNEMYYQKEGEEPSVCFINDGFDGTFDTVVCEPNENLNISCNRRIICNNLRLAEHLLLLQDSDLNNEIAPLYIKPPYTEKVIKKA